MPLLPAASAVPSWDVIEAFETRLKTAVADPSQDAPKPAAGFVSITVASDAQDSPAYKGEEGLHLVVHDPKPRTRDGAGRSGKRVSRLVEVIVVTRCGQDLARDLRAAVRKHLMLEDLVIDAIDDDIPDGVPAAQQNVIGVSVRWVEGGDEVQRKRKIAPDVFTSTLMFEVKYPQRLRVTRATFA